MTPLWPALVLLLQTPSAIPPDSASVLQRLARGAERQYEYLMRSLVPRRHQAPPSRGQCDEIVGRFCLRFGRSETRRPDAEEPVRVIRARREAIETLRRSFAAVPGDLVAAGPLVRYLVEDDRAEEALSAARAFAWVSADSLWGPLVEGYALHAMGEFAAAEARFEEGFDRLPSDEKRRLQRLDVLLSPAERRLYGDLPDEERARYETRAWRLADPLYLTDGNERRSEHYARIVWARLLSQAPVVRGMHRWGRDLEELTIRYGVPVSRERVVGWSFSLADESMVEYYDPNQLIFFPDSLLVRGVPDPPPPGEPWTLDTERARSGYAPASVRKMVDLDHQLTRFPSPGGGGRVRVDAMAPVDSLARGAAFAQAGLFLLDEEHRPLAEVRGQARVTGDSARSTLETDLPREANVYSFEILETTSRFASRARYRVEPLEPGDAGLQLSDPVLAHAFGDGTLPVRRDDENLRPHARLVFTAEQTLGLYAEVHGLEFDGSGMGRMRVELVLEPVDSPSALGRAFRWLGRRLGGGPGGDSAPRLAWETEVIAGDERLAPIAVDLPLEGIRPGIYGLILTVTDLVADRTGSSPRLLRIQ